MGARLDTQRDTQPLSGNGPGTAAQKGYRLPTYQHPKKMAYGCPRSGSFRQKIVTGTTRFQVGRGTCEQPGTTRVRTETKDGGSDRLQTRAQAAGGGEGGGAARGPDVGVTSVLPGARERTS